MKFISLLIFAGALAGQTLSVSVSPVSAYPGGTETVTISLTGSTNKNLAGLQFTEIVNFLNNTLGPTGIQISNSAGAASIAAKKLLNSNPANGISVIAGINQNVLNDGVIAVGTFKVPTNAASGQYTVNLSGALAADLNANGVTLNIGTPGNFNVHSLDLNGDGNVTSDDFDILIPQITGIAICTNGDLNGDGKCDIIDAIILIRGIQGI